MMNRGCSWPMKWEAEKWFLCVSQLFHLMFKIYKYIVVDTHVWSEWHTCHIFSLLRFVSRSLTGPFRNKTWCPLFGAVSGTGLPELQETGHSVACHVTVAFAEDRGVLRMLCPSEPRFSTQQQPRNRSGMVYYSMAALGDWGEWGWWEPPAQQK